MSLYPNPPALQEDDPGWSCLTQGNHVCGVHVDSNPHGLPITGEDVFAFTSIGAVPLLIGLALLVLKRLTKGTQT